MASHGASSPASDIGSVDAVAGQLWRRARHAGADFADVASAVRNLHTALKHLRVEAEDRDSPLYPGSSASEGEGGGVVVRQLRSILEDSDFTLEQLDTVLERYGADGAGGADRPGHSRRESLSGREKDKVALIQTKLTEQKISIDLFLDTVQLRNPVKAQGLLQKTDSQQLDEIKDKVDSIAERLYRGNMATGGETEEQRWQWFRAELEREGFSAEVLRRNKEVLRAYIRELDAHQEQVGNDAPPSVRGLLSRELAPVSTPAAQPAPHSKRVGPQRYSPVVPQVLQPYYHSQPPPAHGQTRGDGLDIERYDLYQGPSSESSEMEASGVNQMAAVISTRDLMALDRYDANQMAARVSTMHLSPAPPAPNYGFSPGTSPSGRKIPLTSQPLAVPGGPPPALSADYPKARSPSGRSVQFGTSPRYVPPLPPYSSIMSDTASMTPPPPYASVFPGGGPETNGNPAAMAQQYSRLAPDSKGQAIPPDASWTRIRRSLVSPEVLEKAGVRYEARPEFVAVLGVLTHEQISEFARQSGKAREARRRSGAEPGRPDARQHSNGYPDEKADRRGYRRQQDNSSGSESEVLWDMSDTSEDERDAKHGHRRGRYVPKERAEQGQPNGMRPYIVSPPVNGNKVPPASPLAPKSILKNKNENRVHFDENGPREIAPDDSSDVSPPRDRSRHRGDRDRHREHGHKRSGKRPEPDRERDEGRHRHRHREGEKERDRDRDRDRDRNRDRDQDRDRTRDRSRRRRDSDRDKDRDRKRDREVRSEDLREDRDARKSALRETLGAVGLGGAAASLLSVLTEAAGNC